MKSPFVRFSRCVRTPLSIAMIGLCTLWGCRHVPGSRHACEDRPKCAPAVASDDETRGSIDYEEPSLAAPISPDVSEPPLVSLSEGDTFPLVPRERPEATSPPSEPALASKEPTPAAESPVVEKSVETEEAAQPTVVARPAVRELPDSDLEFPQPKKLAPTPKELDDDFFPDLPESPPKLAIPPEPVRPTEVDDEPLSELSVEAPPSAATKELASVENDKVAEALKLAPRKKSAREEATVPAVNNEVLSLDSYCDGLVFDSQGFGYVSLRNRIVRFSPTGESSVWTTLNSPKGHRIEPEGTHLICDTERHAVLRLSFDGKVIGVAAKECDGAALRAPYDIAVDPKGGFYFTDPGYVPIKNPIGKLHYVDCGGNVSVVVAKIGYPTGIAFDAERQRLLVVESLFNRIVAFNLAEPGKIESHEVVVQLPKSPDSESHLTNLCLDAAGNLYLTQQRTKAVHVFDPQGRLIGRFSTGKVAPSSVALRATDAAELFFTGELESRTRNGKVIRLDLGK